MEEVFFYELNKIFNSGEANKTRQLITLLVVILAIAFATKIISSTIDYIFCLSIKYGQSLIIKIFYFLGKFRIFLINIFIIYELDRLMDKQIIYISIVGDIERLKDEIHSYLWMCINGFIYGCVLIFFSRLLIKYYDPTVGYKPFLLGFIFMLFYCISDFFKYIRLKRYLNNISRAYDDLNKKYELYYKLKKLIMSKS